MPKGRKRKRKFPYPNLLIAYTVFVLATLFTLTPLLGKLTGVLQLLGLVGIFLGGMLYVSAFTFSIGMITLIVMAPNYNVFLVTLVASAGSVVSDYILFRFVRDELGSELRQILDKLGGRYLRMIFRHRPLSLIAPVVGAIIIASPIPDELGVSLMGLSKIRPIKFALITFVLDAIGIFAIVGFSDLLLR